jgi:hypothetical protein
MGLIVAAFANAYNVYTLPIFIGLFILIFILLTWWLEGRLICLGGVKCLIGVAMSHPRPVGELYKKFGDNDATMNVLLAPCPTFIRDDLVDAAPKEDYTESQQGELTKEHADILTIGREYVTDADHVRKYIKKLHCEFEGTGIRDLRRYVGLILAILIAALAVLLLVPPPFNAAIALFLSLLASIFGVEGLYTTFFDPAHPGDPEDIDPNLADLGMGSLVVVKGRWIYDSLHTGWNEIHGVHACQIICPKMEVLRDTLPNGEPGANREFGPWPSSLPNAAGLDLGLDTPERVKAAVDYWCALIGTAQEAEDCGSREDPKNNWILHPLVDGCDSGSVIL